MKSGRNKRAGQATRAIHLGYDPATAQGALTPPIYLTSTYAFESVEQGAELFRGEREGYIYGRTKNPTQSLLEQRIADLENAEAALVVASGMAAISGTFWSLLNQGDGIVADKVVYGNTYALLDKGVTRFGIDTKFVDFTNLDEVAAAIGPKTKLVYFETPANPNLRIVDIAGVVALAHAKNVLVVVDNTFATPILQRPLDLGADLVIHSATKFLGGHGDLLAGVVAGKAETIKTIRMNGLRFLTGATISPFAAFLMLRGLKTLEIRVERHCKSAATIAERLAKHPAIETLHYPGLADHPRTAIVKRQMSAGGGLIAFEIKGGIKAGMAVMDKLDIIRRAVSLGDAETLIQHPASMTHAAYEPEVRAKHGISDGLIRLSVGLENVEDIWDDLEQALTAVV